MEQGGALTVVWIGNDEYYSADEACRALGVKQATLYSYVNRGLITSYRQGIRRERLYRRSEVDALLEVVPAEPRTIGPEIPAAESWASDH